MSETAPHQELLLDAFGRVAELVDSVVSDAPDDVLTYRPDRQANTVAWLVWHLTRVQDDHVAELAGVDQAWSGGGWADRFALPLDPSDTGYAHDADEVAAVQASAELLVGYHTAVHEETVAYVSSIGADELARVVDRRWDPPVTAPACLISVLGDALQHLGQAAYVRGLAERAR